MRAMKNSGIPWIGEIPEGWNCARMKQIGKYVNGYAFKPEDWGNSGKPIIRIQDLTGSNNSPNYYEGDIDEKYLIMNGDILVSWAATLDAFIWGNGEGWLNQHIFKAIPNTSIQKDFFFWLLKVAMSHMNNDNKHGIVMQHLTLNVFGNFIIPIPPLAEQQRIAEFLDRKCAEVDEMIALQELIIEELKAYKQSVITEAVTKGLNPDVPMKDSGSLWIGEIPTNWNLTRIGDVGEYKKGPFGSAITLDMFVPKGEHTIKVYEQQNAIKKDWTLGYYYLPVDYFESCLKGFEVLPNDIIVSCAGTIGEVYQLPMDVERGIINQALMRMRINSTINLSYFLYIFDLILKREAERSSNGTAIKNIPPFSIFKKILVPLPSLEEQQEIAEYLDVKCTEIDNLISIKQSKIDSLKEYKKSIIYEYVTGKREVE